MPFSLEALTSVTDLDVICRGRAADALAPDRSVGASMHGRVAHRLVRYEVGLFARDGEVARFGSNPGAGRTAAARVTARTPTRKRSLTRLEVGADSTIGDVPEGRYALRGRLTSGDVFFSRVYVNGRRLRFGADIDWRSGPFDVHAEWLRVLDERRGQGLLGETLPELQADGWHLTGVWRVEQTFGRSRAFLNWRSTEPTTRMEGVTFGSAGAGPAERHPRAAHLMAIGERAWTFGVNWSPTPWTRLQLNAIRERPGAAAMTVTGAPSTVWTRVVRFQFAL
jgi:phosphate-selective porin